MPATINDLLNAAGRGALEKVHETINHGVGVNDCNEFGYTPIMSAARSYRVEVVDLLIQLGADVNAITTDGASVLHTAVGETPSQPDRQATCVKMLLDAGANKEATTPLGHTPLMQAAWFGCIDAVRVFLDADADQSKLDSQGRSAKDIAKTRGHESIVHILT